MSCSSSSVSYLLIGLYQEKHQGRVSETNQVGQDYVKMWLVPDEIFTSKQESPIPIFTPEAINWRK